MSRIIFKGVDGSVAIMQLAPEADRADTIRKFHEAHPEMYVECCGDIAVPEDRTYRDAWTIVGNKIVVDESKINSRELTLEERIKQLEDILT